MRKLNFTGSADAIQMALIELAHDLLLPKLISGTVDMMVSGGPNFFYILTLWFYDRGQAGGVRHKLQAATRYSDVSMKTPRQCIKLEEPQRQLLGEWVRAHGTPQQVAKRCQIILQSADGKSDKAG